MYKTSVNSAQHICDHCFVMNFGLFFVLLSVLDVIVAYFVILINFSSPFITFLFKSLFSTVKKSCFHNNSFTCSKFEISFSSLLNCLFHQCTSLSLVSVRQIKTQTDVLLDVLIKYWFIYYTDIFYFESIVHLSVGCFLKVYCCCCCCCSIISEVKPVSERRHREPQLIKNLNYISYTQLVDGKNSSVSLSIVNLSILLRDSHLFVAFPEMNHAPVSRIHKLFQVDVEEVERFVLYFCNSFTL